MSIHLRQATLSWQPGAALAECVSPYVGYDIAVPPGAVLREAFFPGPAAIRIQLDGPEWTMRVGARGYAMPRLSFTGPTCCAGYLESRGGKLIGVGLRASGWAQLFGGDAARHANRVVPLAQLDAGATQLAEELRSGEEVPAVLDRWLLARVGRGSAPDPRIVTLERLLDDVATPPIEQMADTVGMSPRALASFARCHFGFTPKVLLRRARFLRALRAIMTSGDDAIGHIAAAGYWDRSHFLRDSHLFLGCSVRDFNRRRGMVNTAAPEQAPVLRMAAAR